MFAVDANQKGKVALKMFTGNMPPIRAPGWAPGPTAPIASILRQGRRRGPGGGRFPCGKSVRMRIIAAITRRYRRGFSRLFQSPAGPNPVTTLISGAIRYPKLTAYCYRHHNERQDAENFMMGMPAGPKKSFAREKREHDRLQILLSGTVFVRATSTTMECSVLDISANGARVRCGTRLRSGTPIILYVEGIGRLEAVTTRWAEGTLGIKFTCGEAKRQRLVEKLNGLVSEGQLAATGKRKHQRVASVSTLHLVRQDGQALQCVMLDMSLHGLSLKTMGRPPLGEVVKVGNTCGRVVRHHENGIAIAFVNGMEKNRRSTDRTDSNVRQRTVKI